MRTVNTRGNRIETTNYSRRARAVGAGTSGKFETVEFHDFNMRILHAFVGSCVESEVLSEYGDVWGFGIEPTFHSQKNVVDFIQCDLSNGLPVDTHFDFGLFHPPCKRFSTAKATHFSEYENLIPVAREIAENHCEYWCIENVRTSPIGYDPDLRLKGDMFGLDIKYERVFWMNFDVEQPEIVNIDGYPLTMEGMRKTQAEQQKGYSKNYYAHDIIKNSLPSDYVRHIMEAVPKVKS